MGRYVFATANTAAATSEGLSVAVMAGEPWDADDPFVRSHPGLFSEDPPGPIYPRRTVARVIDATAVESTTAAPGERRNTRRRG